MIEISLKTKDGRPPAVALVARFGDAGGDIGRGVQCTLVLEDPSRRISRRQAAIVCRNGRYFISHLGGGTATEIGGQPLEIGRERELFDGDELRIGPYALHVAYGHDATRTRQDDPLAMFGAPRGPAIANAFSGVLDTPAATPRGPMDAASGALSDAAGHSVEFDIGDPTGIRARRARPGGSSTSAPPADPAIAAFLAGAGLTDQVAAGLGPQQMELAGRLLREALQGTLDLLAARTIAKRELHADGTMLRSRDNNPLKFSPSVEVAFGHLLGPTPPGFMAPVHAMRDAFDDLRAHQIAVLAGMRAALNAVMKRFDPQELEVRLTRRSTWDALVPAARKAKLWDVFAESYDEIERETQDDFDALFGRAFLEAYAAQLARLGKPDADPGAAR